MEKKIFKTLDEVKLKNENTPIGTGAFSEVKLVYHAENPNKLYAMKSIQKKNPTETIYIEKEKTLHKSLNHPNIIKFQDSLETQTHIHFFLEYAPNGDLFEYLRKKKKIKKTLLKRFFFQTCLSISYLHSKSIIHRDIKPENLLLSKNLNIKLCDFGWSVIHTKKTERRSLCGTYEYMAPEIFFGKLQGFKTDIWALGILLYELYHGKPPFVVERSEKTIEPKFGRIFFREDLESGVRQLVEGMLVRDCEERLSVREVLQHEFFEEVRGDFGGEGKGFLGYEEDYERGDANFIEGEEGIRDKIFIEGKDEITDKIFIESKNTDLNEKIHCDSQLNFEGKKICDVIEEIRKEKINLNEKLLKNRVKKEEEKSDIINNENKVEKLLQEKNRKMNKKKENFKFLNKNYYKKKNDFTPNIYDKKMFSKLNFKNSLRKNFESKKENWKVREKLINFKKKNIKRKELIKEKKYINLAIKNNKKFLKKNSYNLEKNHKQKLNDGNILRKHKLFGDTNRNLIHNIYSNYQTKIKEKDNNGKKKFSKKTEIENDCKLENKRPLETLYSFKKNINDKKILDKRKKNDNKILKRCQSNPLKFTKKKNSSINKELTSKNSLCLKKSENLKNEIIFLNQKNNLKNTNLRNQNFKNNLSFNRSDNFTKMISEIEKENLKNITTRNNKKIIKKLITRNKSENIKKLISSKENIKFKMFNDDNKNSKNQNLKKNFIRRKNHKKSESFSQIQNKKISKNNPIENLYNSTIMKKNSYFQNSSKIINSKKNQFNNLNEKNEVKFNIYSPNILEKKFISNIIIKKTKFSVEGKNKVDGFSYFKKYKKKLNKNENSKSRDFSNSSFKKENLQNNNTPEKIIKKIYNKNSFNKNSIYFKKENPSNFFIQNKKPNYSKFENKFEKNNEKKINKYRMSYQTKPNKSPKKLRRNISLDQNKHQKLRYDSKGPVKIDLNSIKGKSFYKDIYSFKGNIDEMYNSLQSLQGLKEKKETENGNLFEKKSSLMMESFVCPYEIGVLKKKFDSVSNSTGFLNFDKYTKNNILNNCSNLLYPNKENVKNKNDFQLKNKVLTNKRIGSFNFTRKRNVSPY